MIRLTLFLILTLFLHALAAQDNFTEDFDLNLGSLNNQNQWVGNANFQVTTDPMMLADYPQTNTDGKVLRVQSSGGNIGRDNLLATTFTSGAAYLSFLIRIDNQNQLPTAPAYQVGFEKATFSATFGGFGFYHHSLSNTIRASLTTQSSGDEVVSTAVFAANTVYHVVLKYEFLPAANDVLKVFISPTFMATEPLVAVLTTTVSGTGIPDNIRRILINAPPGSSNMLVVDGLQMGNTWNGFFDLGILPVELADFRGEMKANNAQLYWRTLNESNNEGFLVERSNDGKSFTPIGEVPGNGDSNTPQNYQYLDTSPALGINYYRLTQYDYSGASSQSAIIALEHLSKAPVVRLYPNPSTDYLLLDFSGNDQIVEPENISIRRSDGRRMPFVYQANETVQMIDVSNWEAGWYVLNIRGVDNEVQTMTFIVQ